MLSHHSTAFPSRRTIYSPNSPSPQPAPMQRQISTKHADAFVYRPALLSECLATCIRASWREANGETGRVLQPPYEVSFSHSHLYTYKVAYIQRHDLSWCFVQDKATRADPCLDPAVPLRPSRWLMDFRGWNKLPGRLKLISPALL